MTLSIRTLRLLHHGWSQTYVAERIGVTRQTLAAWESGERRPAVADLARLAVVYRYPLHEITEAHEDGPMVGRMGGAI